MLRRLHADQPKDFAFTAANQAWAEAQITKYPQGRQASAVIPLLWRAQEQEGWLSRPAMERVGDMLDMAYIRVLEVATFYFMFQLQPVGQVAHFQICGTLSCMICGAEDLVDVCKDKIAKKPHEISADGKFSWEEVECLGACANAPMAQVGKDYYEDLTVERFSEIIDELSAGAVPTPGPQNGRYAAEPLSGLTSLKEYGSGATQYNASAQLAVDLKDTVKRIDGTELPLTTPWKGKPEKPKKSAQKDAPAKVSDAVSKAKPKASKPVAKTDDAPSTPQEKPATLDAAREGGADDLKMIKGVGPKMEGMLHKLGFFHFDQVAAWTANEVAWVDENLEGFKGRVSRDNWVDQAKTLASGGETEFASRVKKGSVY
ncbi:MAG: NADH-quinone oxidoreductase subunit NuoE [Planktomarina sp.]